MPLDETTAPSETSDRHSSFKNVTAGMLGWLAPILGLGLWIALPPDFSDRFNSIRNIGFFTALTLSVIVHELAHFFAAKSLGLKPWCIRIGHGDIIFDKEYESFRLVLKAVPYSGAIYPFIPGTRARRLAMIWAGPLSNTVLLLIFLWIASRSSNSLDFSSIPMQMLIANGILLMYSLVPHYTHVGPSDGMHIIELLRGKPFPNRPTYPAMKDFHPSWSWMVKQAPPENILRQYREPLKNTNLSTDQRCMALDTFVTYVLMYGATEYLAEADRYSEELIRLKPDEWTVKGTRGGVLVEKGELQAGITMLEAVMAHDSNAFDRTISASFLALAHFKGNNRAEALRWIAISRQIDPNCVSMLRIEALLDSPVSASNT